MTATGIPPRLYQIPEQLVSGNRDAVREEVRAHLLAGAHVILELAHTRYIDSSGLGVLVTLKKVANDAGQRLILVGLKDELRTLFEMTQIIRLFETADTVPAARAMLIGG